MGSELTFENVPFLPMSYHTCPFPCHSRTTPPIRLSFNDACAFFSVAKKSDGCHIFSYVNIIAVRGGPQRKFSKQPDRFSAPYGPL